MGTIHDPPRVRTPYKQIFCVYLMMTLTGAVLGSDKG